MHYGDDGSYLGFEHTSRPDGLARCTASQQTALRHAVSLSDYTVARQRQAPSGEVMPGA